jgi:signal transduction histidine kinase
MFAVLAVGPFVVLGVFQYMQATSAVRDLLRAHTSAIAERVADRAAERVAAARADLILLASNADVVRFLSTGAGRTEAERFSGDARRAFRERFATIVFRDTAGTEVLRMTDSDATGRVDERASSTGPRRSFVIPVFGDGRRLGTMSTSIALDALVPASALDAREGLSGYTVLIDRSTGRVLGGGTSGPGGGGEGSELIPAAIDSLDARGDTVPTVLAYSEGDSARIASVAPIAGEDLAVLASAAVAEFASPLATSRVSNLSFALAVAVVMAFAFLFLARRLTRPLETLTAAAAEVGRGNLAPTLPASTRDEVGQLAEAFRTMGARLADMMRQVESSRQMAAVGAFAAQISHEIRNPLTSIKLNLQSVHREIADSDEPLLERRLAICLREIQRLDGVVRGVLRLGQASSSPVANLSVHELIQEATELTRGQLQSAGIDLTLALDAPIDRVQGNPSALRGAFLNLILNAAETLEDGGRVHVRSFLTPEDPAVLRVTVADSGPGVAAELKERIFEPFYSTKPGGSGLGLALAARDVETHHGRLILVDEPHDLGGATFAIDLPVVPQESKLRGRAT